MGLIALLALVMAIIALIMVKGLIHGMNTMRVRLDKLERTRGIKPKNTWVALVKPISGRGKKPYSIELEANDEGDAMRQLLLMKPPIGGERVVSLDPVPRP